MSVESPAEVIVQRIEKSPLADSVFYRTDAEYLFVMAEQTASFAAAERFAFAETSGLKFANAIYRNGVFMRAARDAADELAACAPVPVDTFS